MTIVRFFDVDYLPAANIVYSVISARYKGKWIFVRHHLRLTWEICGGHIEAGESPLDAAGRELIEETGALEFDIRCIATYSVEKEGNLGFGRLYLANVRSICKINDSSEIAEVIFSDTLPGDLTYPDIQPHLFRRTIEYIRDQDKI